MSQFQEKTLLPFFAEGTVVSGFGRGSKELGIPTANFPDAVVRELPPDFDCGVYYGWAKVAPLLNNYHDNCSDSTAYGGNTNGSSSGSSNTDDSSNDAVHKMVLCVGWNPYYHNTVKTMETHIIHQYPNDFYGQHLKVIILGYIRPMCDFKSLDALVTAIHGDIALSQEKLHSPALLKFRQHPFFTAPPACTASTSSPPITCSPSVEKPAELHNGCLTSRPVAADDQCVSNGHGLTDSSHGLTATDSQDSKTIEHPLPREDADNRSSRTAHCNAVSNGEHSIKSEEAGEKCRL